MTASNSELAGEVRHVPPKKEIPIVTVAEITAHVGELVYVKGAIAKGEIGKTKKGDPFAKFTLADRAGEVEARVWDTDRLPGEVGSVIGLKAKADEFNGTPQVIVEGVKLLPDEDPANYVRASHLSRQALEDDLQDILAGLQGAYGSVVRLIFSDPDLRDVFFEAPAAIRNHHAYARGLAEHTLSMVLLAEGICEHYVEMYQDGFDTELVVAGVLLHDFAKVLEYERDGLAWSTSIEGELVGHIPSCLMLIHDACLATAVSDETRLRLLHVVASHHGRKDFGSPVEPKLLEAQIVHQVDMLDSRMGMMREALRGVEPGGVSERVWALGGRVVR